MTQAATIELADAVAALLTNQRFSRSFDVLRAYQPKFELADLAAPQVTVVPRAVTITNASRQQSFFDCTIDVGVQQKVSPGSVSELDELTTLVQEIIDALWMTRPPGQSEAAWLRIENDPIFAPEHLEQQQVFTSIISVTYRLRR